MFFKKMWNIINSNTCRRSRFKENWLTPLNIYFQLGSVFYNICRLGVNNILSAATYYQWRIWFGTLMYLYERITTEEVGQLISELSRELSTNEIALFSIVLSAELDRKICIRRKINRKKILILKCSCKISSIVVLLLKIWWYLQKSLR
jgi:hypothetical protein